MEKLNTNIESWIVDLPKQTEKLRVSVAFEAGRATETRGQTGITHLLEHYIMAKLDDLCDDDIYTNGHTHSEHVDIYFELNQDELKKYFPILIKQIVNTDFDDQEILDRERTALINEVQTSFNSGGTRAHLASERLLFGDSCPYTQTHEEETENVKKLTLKDLEDYYKKEVISSKTYLIIGAHKIDNPNKKFLEEVVNREFKDGTSKPREYPACKMVADSVIQKDLDGIAGSYVSFSFPGIGVEESLERRIAVNYVCGALLDFKSPLFRKLRNAGIYNLRYSNSFYKKWGDISLYSHVPRESVGDLVKIVRESLEEFLKEGPKERVLEDRIERNKEADFDKWDSNSDRYSDAVTDILYEGRIYSPKEIHKFIDKYSTEYMREIANEFLSPEKMRVVVSGETVSEKDLK